MAVVKSLKNAKHKKLWVKKFASTHKNKLTVLKTKSKMSITKLFTWKNLKNKKSLNLQVIKLYTINYNCY